MTLVLQDMWYSYEPFQTTTRIREYFPFLNPFYRLPKKSSRISGRFHEKLLEAVSGAKNITEEPGRHSDLLLSDGRLLEIKAWHCRYPQGRKNWVFGPTQLDTLLSEPNIEDYYLALFCYGLSPGMMPELSTRKYGKYILRHYSSNFLIFMRYADCLTLYKQKKISIASSLGGSRRILLFRHVLELAQQRRVSDSSQVFSNFDIPISNRIVPLIWVGTRQRIRNLVMGIDVDPLDLIPHLDPFLWNQKLWSAVGVPVF